MDKYTYNIKADKIQKLVKKGEYAAAVQIADTVDWEEVHSVRLLTITAAAYENIHDYKSAIELLQMAYEESAVGKRILYKLTGLAIAQGDVELAQHYYEMYLQEASDDNGRYLLRYLLAELKGESLDKRIAILETYRKYEFEEEWALRLAQLYDEAGMGDECVKLCDEIVLWFGVGESVDEALALKEKYAPLSAQQQDHRDNRAYYEHRYQEVVEESREREAAYQKAENEGQNPIESSAEEAWAGQILLVEAADLDEAVPKTLERLSAYYREKGKPMGKLTRISAERFNRLGFEASRAYTNGKDVLVDEAAALSDELLSDIVHNVKYEKNPQLFIFADKPSQLPYLDSRLGEFISSGKTIPQILVSEMTDEDVKLHVSDVMNGEEPEELAAAAEETAAEAPEPNGGAAGTEITQEKSVQTALADPASDTAEDSIPEKPETDLLDWAEAAGVIEAADPRAEVSLAQEENLKTPAEPTVESEEGRLLPPDEPAGRTDEILRQPETFDDLPEDGIQVTLDDFLREQEAEAGKAVDQAAVSENAAAEAAEEALESEAETAKEAVASAASEVKDAVEKVESAVAETEWERESSGWSPFAGTFGAVSDAFESHETKRIPVEAVIEEEEKEKETAPAKSPESTPDQPEEGQPSEKKEEAVKTDSDVTAEKPQTLSKESGGVPDGATKVVRKVSNATQAIGPIGMSESSFVEYAKNYIASIDCVLDETGELALQNAAESRKEQGILLTKEEAENMVEEAADLAESKGGLFVRRYDKEGCLILRSKYII